MAGSWPFRHGCVNRPIRGRRLVGRWPDLRWDPRWHDAAHSGGIQNGGAMLALHGKGIVIAVVGALVIRLAMGGYAIYFLFIKKD